MLYFVVASVTLFTVVTTELGTYFSIEFAGSQALKESVWLWYDYTTLTLVLMLTSYKSVLSNILSSLYDAFLLKVLKVEKDSQGVNAIAPHLKPFTLNQTAKLSSDTVLPSKLQRILVTTMMTSPLTPQSLQRNVLVDLYRSGTPNPLYLTTLRFYKNLFVTTDYVLRSQLGSHLNELTSNTTRSSKLPNLLLLSDFNNYSPLLLNYFNQQINSVSTKSHYTGGLGSFDVDT